MKCSVIISGLLLACTSLITVSLTEGSCPQSSSTSETVTGCTDSNDTTETAVLSITDEKYNISGFSDSNTTLAKSCFGVIENEHHACLAGNLAANLVENIFVWIRFSPNISLSYDKMNGTFLGGRVNYTLGYPERKCLALIATNSSKWVWTNQDCSKNFKVLSVNGSSRPSTPVLDGNINLSKEFFRPAECDFNEASSVDHLDRENQLLRYASSEDRICSVKSEALRATIQRGDTCNERFLVFSKYNVACPNVSGDSKIVVAELEATREEMNTYIEDLHVTYDENKRIATLPLPRSKLLSFSILSGSNRTTDGPVNVTFRHELNAEAVFSENAFNLTFENGDDGILATTHRVVGYQPKCVFINATTSKFDSYGCDCVMEGNEAKCSSNHTTVFAVLLVVHSVKVPSSLKTLSVALQTTSAFFLLLAFTILIRVRRKIRGDRIVIQINLVVSLFFMNLWTLLESVALPYPAFCRAVAILSYFFMISSALWMTNEAILLFIKTSRWAFMHAKRRKVVFATMIFGWGIAAVLSIITAAVGFSMGAYMKQNVLYSVTKGENASDVLQYDYCWLSAETGIRWAAAGPIMALLIVNVTIAGKVAVFVYSKRKGVSNSKPVEQTPNKHAFDVQQLNCLSASLKAVVLLLPTLGIPWILMLVSNVNNNTTRLVFMYANVIINGLQGLFVFVVYCVVGKEVWDATKKSIPSLGDSWFSLTDNLEKLRRKSAVPTQDESSSPSRN